MSKITLTFITDIQEFEALETELSSFLDQYNDNPFLTLPFLKKSLESLPRDSVAFLIIARISGKIIGFAPLLLERKLMFKTLGFILKYELSPDFIISDGYREIFFTSLFNCFKILKINSIKLDIPENSPNFSHIQNACNNNHLYFNKLPNVDSQNHALIRFESREEFEKAMTSRFRKKFKKYEKDLQATGQFRIYSYDPINPTQIRHKIYSNVIEIEKFSWKQEWRSQRSLNLDDDLIWLWESCLCAEDTPQFRWFIHFLELNNQAIAYVFTVHYKGTAYIAKTSFVNRYGSLHPGLFILNFAVKYALGTENIQTVDFMTNLDFFKIWQPTYHKRITVEVNGLIPELFNSVKKKIIKLREQKTFNTFSF